MGLSSKSIVYLSLGSNLGDRTEHLSAAQNEISKNLGEIIEASLIYENPPFGFEAEQDFLNLCLKITTEHSPAELLRLIKEIEKQLGRTTSSTTKEYTSRPIDIDIIIYNDLVIPGDSITIPHPRFRQRMFVLKPLNDIATNLIDPVTQLSIGQLLLNCSDESRVTIFNLQ